MKKATLVVALALVLIFAFAATASATTGKFFAGGTDYYRWNQRTDSPSPGTAWVKNYVSAVGSNTVLPGAHANYLATTAKCGMCHSVHRATAGGVKLLPTGDATCSGCHTGSTAITAKLVTWIPVNTNYTTDDLNGPPGGGGGPHNDGPDTLFEDGYWDGSGTPPTPSYEHGARYGCFTRRCHATNPHGANSSQYTLFAAKLLFNNSPADDAAEYETATVGSYGGDDAVYDNLGATDASVQRFADANPGIITLSGGDILINGAAPDAAEQHALVAGLTCGRPSVGDNEVGNDECHAEASYAIVDKGIVESRNHGTGISGNDNTGPVPNVAGEGKNAYRTDNTGAEYNAAGVWYSGGNGNRDLKTGHVAGSFDATAGHASYAPIAGCTSCHDQTDSANTVAGHFTFPHGQTSAGASNLTTDGVNPIPAPTWADYLAGLGVRSRIWAGYAGKAGDALVYTAGTNQKAYDGQCLKCHRDATGNSGIGLTH